MKLHAFDQYITNIFVGKLIEDETQYRCALLARLDITHYSTVPSF